MKETSRSVVDVLAPNGILRAAINLGNATLAMEGDGGGGPVGVSVDLATELAKVLGVGLELVCFSGAGKIIEAISGDTWDVAFLAIDLSRSRDVSFTTPYISLSGSFVVRDDSPVASNEEVDADGVRVVVGKGSAYDLYLSRELKRAIVVRAETSDTVLQMMIDNGYEAAAGVREHLEVSLLDFPGLRLLDGRFMKIYQAIAVGKARQECVLFLQCFIEELKASDFVQQSLNRHRISGVSVAGPE